MAATAKISISVADPDLLAWARRRSKRAGVSLSAVFTEAMRLERQMEARETYLAAEGPAGRASPEEMQAIRAEWGEAAAPLQPPDAKRRPLVARPPSARRGRTR